MTKRKLLKDLQKLRESCDEDGMRWQVECVIDAIYWHNSPVAALAELKADISFFESEAERYRRSENIDWICHYQARIDGATSCFPLFSRYWRIRLSNLKKGLTK